MKTIEEIKKRIAEIEADSRYQDGRKCPATVIENAPLALTQLEIETELKTLYQILVLLLKDLEQWTDEWPTEEGFYWFCGRLSRSGKDGLHFAEVMKVSNGFAHIVGGAFLYEEEGAKGKWQKTQLPALPPENV